MTSTKHETPMAPIDFSGASHAELLAQMDKVRAVLASSRVALGLSSTTIYPEIPSVSALTGDLRDGWTLVLAGGLLPVEVAIYDGRAYATADEDVLGEYTFGRDYDNGLESDALGNLAADIRTYWLQES